MPMCHLLLPTMIHTLKSWAHRNTRRPEGVFGERSCTTTRLEGVRIHTHVLTGETNQLRCIASDGDPDLLASSGNCTPVCSDGPHEAWEPTTLMLHNPDSRECGRTNRQWSSFAIDCLLASAASVFEFERDSASLTAHVQMIPSSLPRCPYSYIP